MQKRDLFLATFSKDAVNVIAKYGIGIEYNQFCISDALDEERMRKLIPRMLRSAENCGCSAPEKAIVHGPFTEIIPMAIDHLAAEYAMTRLNQAYDGCRQLGVNRMVVHSGLMPEIYFPVWHIKKSTEFWKRFMEDKPSDFHLYIENVFDPEPNSLTEIMTKIDDPRVRLCLDVGHAHCKSDPEYDIFEWIRIQGPYLEHFHLHNNDSTSDQHGPVMEGTMDMEAVLAAIDEHCSKSATLTVESRECDESIAWLLKRME